MSTQIDLLKKYGLPIRGFSGQHFLIDPNIQNKIVDSLKPKPDDFVLEIGPGFGALTMGLLSAGCHVYAIEKDARFVQVLNGEFADGYKDKLNVIEKDVLKLNFENILKKSKSKKWKVISNLPYYITAPILFKVLEFHSYFDLGIFMMQKEVASRLNAVPSTKEYGRLTLGIRYISNVRHLFDVSPKCFTPKPKVDSSVVEFDFYPSSKFDHEFEDVFLFNLIRIAFGQRRKTVLRLWAQNDEITLGKDELRGIFQKLQINEKVRAENLLLKDYMAFAHEIGQISHLEG